MPCAAGKEFYHMLNTDQYDQKPIPKVSAKKGRTCIPKQEAGREFYTKEELDIKNEKQRFLQSLQYNCKEVFKAKKINTRAIKSQFDQRHELEQVEWQIASLPEHGDASALGRNFRTRLFRKEEMLRNRFLAQSKPIVSKRELERLRCAAKVVNIEDRIEMLAMQEKEELRMQDEYERTQQHYKSMDDARRRALEQAVQKEDVFGAGDKVKVLERAFVAKHEQDEAVKHANQIILSAKCNAVRDAQLQEKTEMQREMKKEQNRIERMVHENAKRYLSEEDDREGKQREFKAQYAREIREQLSERETLRFLEAERIEEEAQKQRLVYEAYKRDEELLKQSAKMRQNNFRADLERVLKMSQLFKKMLHEQEREADMRIAAYLKQKNERERALSAEQGVAKEAQDRNQKRIYLIAQKILESKSQREEMGFLREQERIEREYRTKEKEMILRKKQIERELTEARELQLQETKYRQAIQIAREENDFNILIQKLKDDQETQQREDMEREKRRRLYRTDIIRQMGDKEMERRRLKEFEMEEASAWRERERQREANVQAVINAKLQAMRDACLPEKYIHDVELQLQKLRKQQKSV